MDARYALNSHQPVFDVCVCFLLNRMWPSYTIFRMCRMCTACNAHNFASRDSCFKCQKPKDAEVMA